MDAQTVNATAQAAMPAWIPVALTAFGILWTIISFLILLYLRSINAIKSEVKEMRAEINSSIKHIHERLESQFVSIKQCEARHEAYREGFQNGKAVAHKN